MHLLKLFGYSAISGWLISRGLATEQNWILSILGIFLWIRKILYCEIAKSFQYTFITWFVMALVSLDWLGILGLDAQIALSTFIASVLGITIWTWKRFIQNFNPLVNAISLGSIVIVVENILSHAPFGGFSWLRFVYLFSDAPFIQSVYVLGLTGMSFFMIFITVLLAQNKRRIRYSLLGVSIFTILLLISLIKPDLSQEDSVNLLAIQGSVPRVGLDFNQQRAAVFTNHVNETRNALRDAQDQGRPDLIIWPENSSDIDPYRNLDVRNSLKTLYEETKVPILFGAVLDQGETLLNAAVLSEETGLETVYIKQKLVPFGEYLPFRNLLAPIISRFDRLSRDFESGPEGKAIQLGDKAIGILICYEVSFDQIWRSYQSVANLNVVMTNNATYGNTKQPIQQLRITRMQAISSGKPVMVASTSGISAYINEHGIIEQILDKNVPGYIYKQVPTVYSKSPAFIIFPYLLGLAHLFVLILFVRKLPVYKNRLSKI